LRKETIMASGKIPHLTMALAMIATPAFAGGTAEQREACTPDAFRLCMSAMPDEGRVESCLRSAGPRLSPACYTVFNPPAAVQAPMQTVRGPTIRAPLNARAQAPVSPPLPAAADDDD
jgi:hypothetical protein